MLVPSIALIWNTSFQSPSPETSSTIGNALSRVRRRSVLLMETIAGVPEPATRRARYLSPFPSPSEACSASKSNRMTSDSERLSTTCSCILARRVSRGFWELGVSTKTAWYPGPFLTPRIRLRVVWDRDEVMETFWPTSLLTKVLLPTLGLPTTAIKPLRIPLFSTPRAAVPFTGPPVRRSWEGSGRTGSALDHGQSPRRPHCNRTPSRLGGRPRKGSMATCWG